MSEIQKNILKIILVFSVGGFLCSYVILLANSNFMFERPWKECLSLALTHHTNLKVMLCAFVSSLLWALPILYFQRLKIGWLFSLCFMLPIIFSIKSLYLYFWPPEWDIALHKSLMLSFYSTWKFVLPTYILLVSIPFWPTKKKNPRKLSARERSGILTLFMFLSSILMVFFADPYIIAFILLPAAILVATQRIAP